MADEVVVQVPITLPARKRKPGAGRKPSFRHHYLAQIEQLIGDGLPIYKVVQRIGVSRQTFATWKQTIPAVAAAMKRGEEIRDDYQGDTVERSLYKRATGTFKQRSVKIMQHQGVPVIVPYVERFPPDVGAAQYWLNNRRPDKWKNRIEGNSLNMGIVFSSSILPAHVSGGSLSGQPQPQPQPLPAPAGTGDEQAEELGAEQPLIPNLPVTPTDRDK